MPIRKVHKTEFSKYLQIWKQNKKAKIHFFAYELGSTFLNYAVLEEYV